MNAAFPVPPGYRVLNIDALPEALAETAVVAARLGGAPERWQVREISDGNMNAVFRVIGPSGSVVAKQALPYIRAIGPDWPFPVSRARFEHRALEVHGACLPGRTPAIIAYCDELALIVMEDLRHHVVLRHALVAGRRFPCLAAHMGEYLARSLVLTSDLALNTTEKNALADRFSGNSVLCETTQDVVFTGPYHDVPLNRLTPGQEACAAAFRADRALKQAVTEMKYIFRSRSEALLHGDLHTGSVMVTDTDTRVIDPEWAFMGPMGFDIGALLGNLLLAHSSQRGFERAPGERQAQAAWLLSAFAGIWESFAANFRALAHPRPAGAIPRETLDDDLAGRIVAARLRAIFEDSLGFAGAKMIRRILGISHVEDFEAIADIPLRAACEARALDLARWLLLERCRIGSPAEIVDRAETLSRA